MAYNVCPKVAYHKLDLGYQRDAFLGHPLGEKTGPKCVFQEVSEEHICFLPPGVKC